MFFIEARKTFLALTRLACAAAGLAAGMATNAATQTYPAKPIHIVVGQTAGGVSDLIARMVAQCMTDSYKQPVLVENRAGAAGNIGTKLVVNAAPDGYTLLLSSAGPIVINPGLYPKLGYDPLRALTPIAFIASSPLVLVTHPAVPAKSVRELIALARAQPQRLSYGSGGNGSPAHLTAELFKSITGTQINHVPFKGSAPSVAALVGGQIDLSFSTVAVTLPQVNAGRLRAIAVTSPRRHRAMAQLPTMIESGMPGFESTQWFGLFGPAPLPQEIVLKLHGEIARWLDTPEPRARLVGEGAEPGHYTLREFKAFLLADAARWARLIKLSGATAD